MKEGKFMFNIKRLATLVLVAGMLLQPTTAVLAEQEGLQPTDEEVFLAHLVKNYTIGDVNCDYNVTVKDAVASLRYALNIKAPDSTYQKFVSDVDGNGKVTLEDASEMLRMALNLRNKKYISSVTQAVGSTKAFIQEVETEEKNQMRILTSKEQLAEYLGVYLENKAVEVSEKYSNVFEKNNLLAVNVRVYTDSVSDLHCYTTINNRHIMTQIVEDAITDSEKTYTFFMFMCVDKTMTKDTAVLSLEDREVTNKPEIIAAGGVGEPTADYTEATQHRHLIRNIEEMQAYKQFLRETYQLDEDGFLKQYIDKMDAEHFNTHAYAVFTYHNPSGSFSYVVTGLRVEDRVLKVQLKYIDENEPGVPGMKDGLNCVFVEAPVLVLDNADQIELEIIE